MPQNRSYRRGEGESGATGMETGMSTASRREYFRTQRARYRRARRAEKQGILDEACEMFGMHRKSLIRALNRAAVRSVRRAGHPRVYDETLLGVLKAIWLAGEQPCGKRFAALLPTWLAPYERRYGALDPAVRARVLAASPSTLDRLLRPLRARRKGLCGTRAVRRLEGQIPIRTNFREVDGPGTFEADRLPQKEAANRLRQKRATHPLLRLDLR